MRPGRYDLTVQSANSARNATEGVERQTIEVALGQDSVQTRLTMHDHETQSFTVSGVVKGVAERGALLIRPSIEDSAVFYWARGARIEEEGKFVVVGVPKGRFDMFLNSGQEQVSQTSIWAKSRWIVTSKGSS
ncbi:MAG: hypothetical protein R2724_07060 [Bryobacterales bacterium]